VRARREFLVAVQQTTSTLVGALSFHRLPRAFGSLRLRVIHGERRRGIGTALLRAAIEEGHRRNAAAIWAKVKSRDDPDASAFLVGHGFSHVTRLVRMEADFVALRATTRALRERLAARGRIPAQMRIVSFAEAPRDQLARLYAEHIAHNPELTARLHAPSQSDTHLAASPVAMIGNDVAGFVLWSCEGDTAFVLAKVVAPLYRGGWANVVVMDEAFAGFAAAGARRTRFDVLSTNHDTLKLARRLGADTTATQDVYRLDLMPAQE
jgi:ribosomal protein S18 acetylase RimI-like enzyme